VDFVTEDLTKSTSPVLRSVDRLDDLAKVYEGPSWKGIYDALNAELGLPSYEEMATMLIETVGAEGRVGLDVACGTGALARSVAAKVPIIYGIDISMGMLEKATEYAREKGIGNIRFARANVERLPFPDGVFDWVTCTGALHGFPDTGKALSEMARVMKTGGRLGVLTFLKQGLPTLKMHMERLGASKHFEQETLEAVHLFDVEELRSYLAQTGFTGFAYDIYGPAILFHAEKG
jgi:ubiquinone/menaquinone biosynthesis C-methylase UbiE